MNTKLWIIAIVLAVAAMAGCDDVVRPQAVIEVRVLPDSAHIAVGESVVYEARARDRAGNELTERNSEAEWEAVPSTLVRTETGPEPGTVQVRGLAVGSADVTARFARRDGSSRVFIYPAELDRIEIEPSPVVTSNGMLARPRARLLDADGEELSYQDFRISWQTVDPTIASAGQSVGESPRPIGTVQGRTLEGQTLVRLIVNDMRTTAEVIVIREPIPTDPPEVVEATPTSVELAWSWVSRATVGYRVERSTSVDGPFEEIAAIPQSAQPADPEAHFLLDDGLTPETTYHYRLRNCNQYGCSEPTEATQATTLPEGSGS